MKLKQIIKRVVGGKIYYLIKKQINKFKWFLNKPALPGLKDNMRFIHLGCGGVNHKDFINVDLRLYPHVHYVRDITDLSIFPDGFADLIYVCHSLEHISHLKVGTVLEEWVRVLKPGGTLRVSVPDFDSMVQIYEENEKDLDLIIRPLMGAQDFPANFHYTSFNEKTLSRHFFNAGLKNVRKWVHGTAPYT
ncbi:methyltransferase domain-containing protein [Thermodesulfobacteriota bacterium]